MSEPHDTPTPICDETQHLLPFFVNGSLEPQEHRSVRHHLIRCAACRAETRRLEGLMEMLSEQRLDGSRTESTTTATPVHFAPATFERRQADAELQAHRFRPGLLAAALIGAFALGSLLAPLSHLQDLSVPDQIAADQDAETTKSTFDDGFESGDLGGWTLFDSFDGPAGSDDKSPTSKGDPS